MTVISIVLENVNNSQKQEEIASKEEIQKKSIQFTSQQLGVRNCD